MQIRSLMQPGAFGPEAIAAMVTLSTLRSKSFKTSGGPTCSPKRCARPSPCELSERQDLASVTRLAYGRRHFPG
jgi:hypothetical protein